MTELTQIESLTYEQAFAALETIIQSLEADQSSLEDAIALFERGQDLSRHCSTLLEQAELRIRQLTGQELRSSYNEDEDLEP